MADLLSFVRFYAGTFMSENVGLRYGLGVMWNLTGVSYWLYI